MLGTLQVGSHQYGAVEAGFRRVGRIMVWVVRGTSSAAAEGSIIKVDDVATKLVVGWLLS